MATEQHEIYSYAVLTDGTVGKEGLDKRLAEGWYIRDIIQTTAGSFVTVTVFVTNSGSGAYEAIHRHTK